MIGAWLARNLASLELIKSQLLLDQALTAAHVNHAIHSLVIDGIFTGVGSVLSLFTDHCNLVLLPYHLMEDSGYIARVAFVMDKLLRKIGLVWTKYCTDADRLWLYSSGGYGNTEHLTSGARS